MTGLGERVATDLISSLLEDGYLATDSAYGAFDSPFRAQRCSSI